jgi:hypothetical protein
VWPNVYEQSRQVIKAVKKKEKENSPQYNASAASHRVGKFPFFFLLLLDKLIFAAC